VADRVPASILARIRRATAEKGGTADAELLRRFAVDRDESAFELLLWRHSRLVFGVCLRILRDVHDAEDAFQATFLALARHAGRIARRETVACWLHTVACRVAFTSRRRRTACESRERVVARAESGVVSEPRAENRELRDVLDQEISRLPDRFRSVVVFCYLENKTVDEAAGLLGCPRGTVASRLARARQRLRAGLARRGFDPSAVIGVFIPATAVLRSYSLIPTLTAAATGSGAGSFAAVSPRITALTREVLRAMLLHKIKTAVVIPSTFVGVLLAGAGLVIGLRAHAGPATEPPAPAEVARPKPAGDRDKPGEPPLRTVTVSRPVRRDAAPYQDFVGRLEARQAVDVRPVVSGVVSKVHFKAGADVKQSDLLIELDPRAATLTLQKSEADLTTALAKKNQADAEFDRARRLATANTAPREDVDANMYKVTVAEAAVKAAQVEVARAKLDLDATRIVAPMSGQVGRPLAEPGTLVFRGPDRASVLTTVTSLDPIGVTFEMDERTFLDYQRQLRDKQVKGPGSSLRLALTGEDGFPHEATLEHFEDRVIAETGTVRVRGILPNPGRLLLPGMFAKVRIAVGPPRAGLEVSGDALLSDQGQAYVFVVNDRNVVERRPVTAGQSDGKMRFVVKGLHETDWVIIAGQSDVRPGDTVEPRKKADPDR
jgi:RND family efflux transporter MFP subunit